MQLNKYGNLWHREQIKKFNQVRSRYEAYADFLDKVLKRACEKLAPLSIVQVRAKTVPSFAEKAIRKLPPSERLESFTSEKHWKDYFDPVNEFTDLCGARVITQTQQEMDRFCHFIRDHFEIDAENSEDKRKGLRSDQFGYLSVHYIVQVPDQKELFDIPIGSTIRGIKAEVQVRTLLQHAWADISHDSLYKHQFQIPDRWQRDMARLAAVLEAADGEFSRFVENLHAFAGNYRAYLTRKQIDKELSTLDVLIKYAADAKDLKTLKTLNFRKAGIFEAMAEWSEVDKTLTHDEKDNDPLVLKKRGNALCREYRKTPSSEEYQKGQRYLEEATQLDAQDAEAWANLAWSWEPLDKQKAREDYARAYGLQPSDPYYLASFLEFEIDNRGAFPDRAFLEPILLNAIQACRSHAEVGIELPRSLFTLGRLSLLIEEPDQGLAAYIEAIDLLFSPDGGFPGETLDDELRFLNRMEPLKESLPGLDWFRMLVLTAQGVKDRSRRTANVLPEFSNRKTEYQGPVVVIAGSCSKEEKDRVQPYRDLVGKALVGFQGEVISGGTTSGVSGIAGGLSKDLNRRDRTGFKTYGYLPELLPGDARPDNGYDILINTSGKGFSPLEPLQMWLDLTAAGVPPSQVKVIGIGGGKIAALEYRLALALGAAVGVFPESHRAAEELLNDPRWSNHRNLVTLIPDPMTIRGLLLTPSSALSPAAVEKAARCSHNRSLQEKRHKVIDPSMVPWDKLDKKFKLSSTEQKRYAEAILRYEGYGLQAKDKEKIRILRFPPEKLNRMAEMEHGRWTLERTRNGWKKGEERDPDNKITPYLQPWSLLPDKIKKWDLKYVKGWPKDFKEAGIEIYKLKETK
jgi:ppGpp synthetase/RelA/SpoT-type nucleotidyltranferase